MMIEQRAERYLVTCGSLSLYKYIRAHAEFEVLVMLLKLRDDFSQYMSNHKTSESVFCIASCITEKAGMVMLSWPSLGTVSTTTCFVNIELNTFLLDISVVAIVDLQLPHAPCSCNGTHNSCSQFWFAIVIRSSPASLTDATINKLGSLDPIGVAIRCAL